jgi:hypothetical protein
MPMCVSVPRLSATMGSGFDICVKHSNAQLRHAELESSIPSGNELSSFHFDNVDTGEWIVVGVRVANSIGKDSEISSGASANAFEIYGDGHGTAVRGIEDRAFPDQCSAAGVVLARAPVEWTVV